MKIKALLVLFFMLAGSAWAQVPEDPTARMTWLQEAEESLLSNRRALLDREADLAEPLWITNDEGLVTVVDGGRIYDNAAVLAELAASLAIDETLGPDADKVVRNVAEMLAAGKVRDVRATLKTAYEKTSKDVRSAALVEIERQLEAVREAFTATMQQRDGAASTEEQPQCPTGYKSPYSASDPICYAYDNGNGACPPGFPYRNRFGHCRTKPWH